MLNDFSGCIKWGLLLITLLLASACGKSGENTYQPHVSGADTKPKTAIAEYIMIVKPRNFIKTS